MRNINVNLNTSLSQQEISKWDEVINSLSGTCSELFNYFAGLANITNRSIPSQTYLAKKFGVCRATINRALKRLAELGLIQKIDRGWKEDRTRIKKTCFYIVSRIFDLPEIRKRYAHKFKSLNYLKLVGKFEDLIASGFKHYDNIVTGIRTSLNCLFINRSLGSSGSLGSLRRSNHSNLTIEEGNVMNEFISTLGGFNEEAKTYLSAYDEGVVKEAIRCLGKTVPNGNQFTYFTKILNRVNQDHKKSPDLGILNTVTGKPQLQVPITSPHLIASSSPKPFYRKGEQEKKHVPSTAERMQRDKERRAIEEATRQERVEVKITLLELAHRIANVKEQAETNAFLREMLPETITGLINCGYRTTGEQNEDIAMAYLEKQKVKYNLTIPEPTPTLKDPSSNPQSLGNLINQVLPPKPLQKGEMLNNGAPLPERLEMLAKARERLGLPPKQEPTRQTTAIPVNTVAKALEDPAIKEKVLMIKESFPSAQVTEVQGEEEEFEPESTTYNEIEYEEVLT